MLYEQLHFSFHVPSGIIFGVRMTQMQDTCKSRVWVREPLFLLDRTAIVSGSAHGHCLRHLSHNRVVQCISMLAMQNMNPLLVEKA